MHFFGTFHEGNEDRILTDTGTSFFVTATITPSARTRWTPRGAWGCERHLSSHLVLSDSVGADAFFCTKNCNPEHPRRRGCATCSARSTTATMGYLFPRRLDLYLGTLGSQSRWTFAAGLAHSSILLERSRHLFDPGSVDDVWTCQTGAFQAADLVAALEHVPEIWGERPQEFAGLRCLGDFVTATRISWQN